MNRDPYEDYHAASMAADLIYSVAAYDDPEKALAAHKEALDLAFAIYMEEIQK